MVDPWATRTCNNCGRPTLLGHWERGGVVVLDTYADAGGTIMVLLMRDGKLIVAEKEAGTAGWKRAFFRHAERCKRVERIVEAVDAIAEGEAA
jgi:hypothetical protein